jgi:Protein of unknown function (DUF3375)
MDYQTLKGLRRRHPAWRLLVADHAPMIVGFLYRTFIEPNVRTLGQQELASRLRDYLYRLNDESNEESFPQAVERYLDDWSSDDHGWLRKYYRANNDEPYFDITPATEKAIDWLTSLGQRQFVGTESRLLMVFDLLRQLAEGTEIDPGARIAELEKRKAQIDTEIQRIQEGHIELLDTTQVKDRFLQMASTAQGLRSDFRTVEQNFRDLDRAVRERIASWEGAKGALLEEIFGKRDAIAESDQGRSFRSFWDFLMSPARQEQLSVLLETVFALEAVKELAPDPRLLRIHYDWMEAGEVAQRTVARLSEQLRRYLDDQTWLENRRIMQIIKEIEQSALAVRKNLPEGQILGLDEPAPTIDLTMDRPLFSPPFKLVLSEQAVIEGDHDIPADVLFEQVYVDKMRLAAHVRRALQTRSQISLAELVADWPLEHGLAELVAYLSLAAETHTAIIDDSDKQMVSWTDAAGISRQATLPLVIFSRHVQQQFEPRLNARGQV